MSVSSFERPSSSNLSGVVLDQEARVVVDAAQRLLQVVRGDVGEVVELPVASAPAARCALRARARRDGARRAPATAEPCARPPAASRVSLAEQQLGVAAFDLRQHVVECRDEHPDLVFSVWRRPQRVVLTRRYRARRVGQPQQRVGHEPLQPRGQQERQEPRRHEHQRHGQHPRAQPLVRAAQAAPHVDRADPLARRSTMGRTISMRARELAQPVGRGRRPEATLPPSDGMPQKARHFCRRWHAAVICGFAPPARRAFRWQQPDPRTTARPCCCPQ